jgi:flagellar basal body rod protein FlgG
MDISSIALQGVAQAEAQLESVVSSLASGAGNGDTVDIASQIVAMTSAQASVELNLSALKSADQLQATLLNLFA